MKKLIFIGAFCTALLAGCSKSSNFAGIYESTFGDDCEVQEGDGTFISIFPSESASDTYTARLDSRVASAAPLPLESKPGRIDESGNLVLQFFREGKSGMFSAEPSVEMTLKLVPKDSNHLMLESWPIKISVPGQPSLSSGFDFIKDAEIPIAGTKRKAPNLMSHQAGKSGLCLKRKDV